MKGVIANVVGAGLAPSKNKIFNFNTGRPRPTPTFFTMRFYKAITQQFIK